MAMRKAMIPAPTKPIHQAPTHSGLSVVNSVLLGEAVVLGLLTSHPRPFQHMHGALTPPRISVQRATEAHRATVICSPLPQTGEAL